MSMHRGTRTRVPIHALAVLTALLATAVLAVPSPAGAASGPDISVQIEGETATVVEQRDVSLDYNKFSPPAPWPGSSAPANSIAAAIEASLNDTYGEPPAEGWWDRQPFVSTIKDETLIWPMTWSFWVNDTYTNKGAMDGGDQWGLDYGDEVLISGGGSVGEWPEPTRPERLPVDLAGTGINDHAAAVPVGSSFPVNVTAWMPQEGDTDMPPGPSDRMRASHPIAGEDFTVVALPAGTLYDSDTASGIQLGTAKTDGAGNASISIDQAGEVLLKAVRENDTVPFGASPLGAQGRSEAHEVCVYEPNSGDCGTPVFTPAAALDAGEAKVGEIGNPVGLGVAAPEGANTVTGVRVFGPDAADFIVSAGNCVDESVPAGQSCDVKVRLAPTATGSKSATLRVKSASESLPRDIALTGTGVSVSAPAGGTPKLRLRVRMNPTSRKVRRGGKLNVDLTISNTGDGRADDVLICLRRPNGFRANRACAKRPRLAAGASAKVRFRLRAKRRARVGKRVVRVRATANGIGFTSVKPRLRIKR